MKKFIALLAAAALLFASAALAQDLSGMTDDELMMLLRSVQAEMENRGLSDTETLLPGEADTTLMMGCVRTFFSFWKNNNLDAMLTLCSSDWAAGEENPRTSLFALAANRTPKSIEMIAASGEPDVTEKTVTVHSMIDRNNGKGAYLYRLQILMKKESDGQWYIDPRSLSACELIDESYPTAAPTETPAGLTGDTLLYYQPTGGEYYHADPNCRRVHEKYLPLSGSFTYAELNEGLHDDLMPCAVCGAPLKMK